jgi:uncharacterized membrane protein
MTQFIGRFHPLLVHLPIGILLIAALFQWMSRREKFRSLQMAGGIALFWGMLMAIFSCITGFLLSQTGEYDQLLVDKHQWFGIGVATISMITYYLHRKNSRWVNGVMGLMVIGMGITGHLGGTLTHGEGYLTSVFSTGGAGKKESTVKPIANVQEAVVYTDIVQPILAGRCYGCHGPSKQKGKLRMDELDLFLKGGKHGKVFVAGKEEESEMVKRLLLPRDDEEHMPPKEKPQPTKREIELLQWWISCGASFDKKVNQLEQPEKVKPLLLALQNGTSATAKTETWIPETPVAKADEAIVKKLKDAGVAIVPVAKGSNYLSANFVAIDTIRETEWKLLASLKAQLIELRTGSGNLTDAGLGQIAGCTTLRKLYLDNTNISDPGLAILKPLVHLQYLNLVNTKVTAKGLLQLTNLPDLSAIYFYKTDISSQDWAALQKAFPKAVLDSGKYRVQFLPGDTSEFKKPAETRK